MKRIILLVLEVILLVLKTGMTPEEATRTTANNYGADYSKIWEAVNKRWK